MNFLSRILFPFQPIQGRSRLPKPAACPLCRAQRSSLLLRNGGKLLSASLSLFTQGWRPVLGASARAAWPVAAGAPVTAARFFAPIFPFFPHFFRFPGYSQFQRLRPAAVFPDNWHFAAIILQSYPQSRNPFSLTILYPKKPPVFYIFSFLLLFSFDFRSDGFKKHHFRSDRLKKHHFRSDGSKKRYFWSDGFFLKKYKII